MILNNSLEYSEEVTKIWREYNRQLTGSDYISRDAFKGIREHKPSHQTEILAVMYNHGRSSGIERAIEEVEGIAEACWNDREYKAVGDEYVSLYNEIAQSLPPEKRELVARLEMTEIRQNKRIFKILKEKILGE